MENVDVGPNSLIVRDFVEEDVRIIQFFCWESFRSGEREADVLVCVNIRFGLCNYLFIVLELDGSGCCEHVVVVGEDVGHSTKD